MDTRDNSRTENVLPRERKLKENLILNTSQEEEKINLLYTSLVDKIRTCCRHGVIARDRPKQGRAIIPSDFTAIEAQYWLPQSLTSHALAPVLFLDSLEYNQFPY